MFITEKQGYVRVFKDGQIVARPLLDLRDQVNSEIDRGLVGIAVDPHFGDNGFVYLLFTYDAPGQARAAEEPRTGRLVRYTVQDQAALPESATVLLDDYAATTPYHAVDTLRFAEDGALFVSLGDGSFSAERNDLSYRAQDLDTLNGKILRLNPATGDGLPDNPFYSAATPHSARSRVWAYGMRNPFRFAIRPGTNVPYVGIVGWNSYETLVRATRGANAGWPCFEGFVARPEYDASPICANVKPLPAEAGYPHSGNNASITGGDFNTGANFPADMRGDYFFGDYSQQVLRRARLNPDGRVRSVSVFARGVGDVVDIQFGPDGALYYLNVFSGALRRVRATETPLAKMQTDPGARPALTLRGPGENSVIRAGERVSVRAALAAPDPAGVDVYWWVSERDSADPAFARSIARGTGLTAAFEMPELESAIDSDMDRRYVDVRFAATDARLRLGQARLRLYSPPRDGYIRSWLFTRAWPDKSVEDDKLAGEAGFAADSGDLTVYPVHSPTRRIDVKAHVSPNGQTLNHGSAMTYAFVWIDSPSDREALLGLNSDESIAAYFNGAQAWFLRVEREVGGEARDVDLPKIALKKGLNSLLLKVHQTKKSDDTWQFQARVLNLDGSVMPDVAARTQRP